jgi:hypothetical protein
MSAARSIAGPARRTRRRKTRAPKPKTKVEESSDQGLARVAAEMALPVLAYNLTRVMNILGVKPLIAAIAA